MEISPIVLLCLCLVAPIATGLNCKECTYSHVDSDDETVKTALKDFLNANEDCAEAAEQATSKKCDKVDGKVSKCMKVAGSFTATVGGKEVTLEGTARRCAMVDSGVEDKCTDLDSLAQFGLDIPGAADIDGKLCYCSADNCNGQPTLNPAIVTCLLSLVSIFFLIF